MIGEDVPRSLVEFARSANATQIVIGVSRRGRLAAAITGPGIGAVVIRESGDIDVQIVTHAAAGGRFALPRIPGIGPQPSQLIISMADRALPFGEAAPEAIQYFEAFRLENGQCVWELY